jgi:hypothetical protein
MGAQVKARLALRPSTDRHELDGAWWPRTRSLQQELVDLFEAWPAEAGYISRVLFARRDWDDCPSLVDIPRRRGRVKAGALPADVAHHLVLVMLDGQRRSLVVVPPRAPEETAVRYLRAFDPYPGRATSG